ncbi:hypothetical protein MMC17_003302 [Xylographa soralifera]|nr:hypothetical protein [Xylographa soralifera]
MGLKRIRKDDSLQSAIINIVAVVLDVDPSKLDVGQSFLFYGGHSLTAISLCSKCKSQGIILSVKKILRSVSITELVDLAYTTDGYYSEGSKRPRVVANSLGGSRKGFSTFVQDDERPKPVSSILRLPFPRSEAKVSTEDYDLTEMQMSLLAGSQRDPGTNVIQFFDTFMTIHVPELKEAWERVIEMEPVFQSWQMLPFNERPSTKPAKSVLKWTQETYDSVSEYQAALDAFPIEPSAATSFRAVRLRQDSKPDVTTIIWNVHHALIDGYSASLVYQKVRHAAEGHDVRPGTSFFHVAGELSRLHKGLRETYQRFWKQQQLQFPCAAAEILLARPTVILPNTAAIRDISITVDGDGVRTYCRQHGVTVASLHYSAWSVVLSRYTDADSVVFGSVVSGRSLPIEGIEDTVGPLINTIPFYVSVIRSEGCEKHISNVFRQILRQESLQASVPQDGYSRDFSSAIATEIDIKFSGASRIQAVAPNSFRMVSNIPIIILVRSDGTAHLSYRTERYAHADIELLAEQYSNAVTSLILPDVTIERCMSALLPRRCHEFLVEASNYNSVESTRAALGDDLVTLFEATAAAHANVVAVEAQSERLSYAELNDRAERVACHLRRLIKTGDVICVHADRSMNWIIAIYGILKANGIYAPFDPSLPGRTRELNYQTANGCIFLTPQSSQRVLAPSICSLVLSVEDILTPFAFNTNTTSDLRHRCLPQPAALAYICFTSGSTGKPKGVLCHHGGLVAFQKNKEVRLHAEPGCRIAQIMSPAFDGSIHEIFSALSYGATLVLPKSSDMISHLSEATSTILTPSLALVLNPDDYPLLQNVYLVGEPVSQQVNDVWARSKKLYNMYGPTEATCGATIKRLHCGEPVTIGRPNVSSRVYILDRYHEACTPGVLGDIYIAGIQVAKGYVNRPKETAQRFLPDSLRPTSGEMMYSTGDRGYWDLSMEIHCLGRTDRQIKLNGFRLDLNVLEEQISKDLPEVSAVALVRKADYLLAAVQPGALDTQRIKSQLAQILPPYALPRYLVALDKFPATTAGKLDYAALASIPTTEYNSPSPAQWTDTEKIIADMWRDVLKLDPQVSLTPVSSFVSLGGHSISQLLLTTRLSEFFKRSIQLQVVMEAQNLRDLAAAIDQIISSLRYEPQILQSSTSPYDKISAIETEWVQKYRLREGCSTFNVSVAWNFDPKVIDRQRLELAWNDAIDRHSILRSYYVGKSSHTIQRKYHDSPPRARCVRHVNIAKEIDRPFRVDKDHLIRIKIASHQMVVSLSHIICDLTTLYLLLSEVVSLYQKTPLGPVSRAYPNTLQRYTLENTCRLDFWSNYLRNPAPLRFLQRSIPSRKTYKGASDARRLPRNLLSRLCRFADTYGYTFHQLGLAAVCLASQPEYEELDLIVGAPYLNRQPGEMKTIGLFLEPLPMRVKYQPADLLESTKFFMDFVQRCSQSAVAHAVPWSKLLQHLKVAPDFPNHPLFDVMVTFHDNRSTQLFQLPSFKQVHTWSGGSKFKLMLEFSALSEEDLVLRIEYDSQCFTSTEITRLQTLIAEALECLVANMTISEARTRLLSITDSSNNDFRLEAVRIGSPVNDL